MAPGLTEDDGSKNSNMAAVEIKGGVYDVFAELLTDVRIKLGKAGEVTQSFTKPPISRQNI